MAELALGVDPRRDPCPYHPLAVAPLPPPPPPQARTSRGRCCRRPTLRASARTQPWSSQPRSTSWAAGEGGDGAVRGASLLPLREATRIGLTEEDPLAVPCHRSLAWRLTTTTALDLTAVQSGRPTPGTSCRPCSLHACSPAHQSMTSLQQLQPPPSRAAGPLADGVGGWACVASSPGHVLLRCAVAERPTRGCQPAVPSHPIACIGQGHLRLMTCNAAAG